MKMSVSITHRPGFCLDPRRAHPEDSQHEEKFHTWTKDYALNLVFYGKSLESLFQRPVAITACAFTTPQKKREKRNSKKSASHTTMNAPK